MSSIIAAILVAAVSLVLHFVGSAFILKDYSSNVIGGQPEPKAMKRIGKILFINYLLQAMWMVWKTIAIAEIYFDGNN